MKIDLSQVEPSSGGGELIPHGTIARAVINVRPGGAAQDPLLKLSRDGSKLMLDMELTIIEGPWTRRKVFDYITVAGGSEKNMNISQASLRAIIDVHHNLHRDDHSPNANAIRQAFDTDQLTGMTCCIKIGIEEEAGYDPKNRVVAYIEPGDGNYLQPGQIQEKLPPTPLKGPQASPGAPQAPAAAWQAQAAPQAAPAAPAPAPQPQPAPAPQPVQQAVQQPAPPAGGGYTWG